jgi:hypothetical protein
VTDLSTLSHAARRRFVKDYSLPIQVVPDPHFAYLLDLYEPFFGSRTKLGLLIDEIRDSGSEEAFFVRANRLSDAVIKAVRDTPAYQFLSEDHLADYDIGPSTFAADSLYHPDNDGRAIIAVDLVKANFQAMRYLAALAGIHVVGAEPVEMVRAAVPHVLAEQIPDPHRHPHLGVAGYLPRDTDGTDPQNSQKSHGRSLHPAGALIGLLRGERWLI